jgi:DNA-binding NtrC family response regulator
MTDPTSKKTREVTTVERPRFDVPTGAPTAFVFDVSDGPDKGARFVLGELDPSPTLLGQSPACGFRLTDREVSRRHASLEIDRQRLRLLDLGSKNGTLVNGVAVVDAYVRTGQTIRVGATSIRVARAKPASTAPATASAATGFGPLIGASFEMRKLYQVFERLAASSLPLVIEGETGTGKELLAEALHAQGPRAGGPFVVFDCTTVATGQVEAELFGTDVAPARPGLFEQAHRGTLLLDEVAELDMALQPKLLRAIERGAITPAGGQRKISVDVRVVAVTNHDLDHDIQAGRFREDLYHRLVVSRVALPPLRKRIGDIELLANHFVREFGGAAPIPPMMLARWQDHGWPGNVRELKNAVARALMLGDAETPSGYDGSATAVALGASAAIAQFVEIAIDEGLPLAPARQRVVQVYDRHYVEKVLAKHGDNVTRAASAAGIERRYFQILRARRKPK